MPTTTTVPFGSTGLHITRAGFGAWAAGGSNWRWAWGTQSDEDSVAAIRRALEGGVNWIDTAAIYGNGHSEVLVGEIVRSLPEADRPLVFTKGGVVWDPENPAAHPAMIGAADSLRRECEASLTRLGLETIDLYQVHQIPGDGVEIEDYWSTMVDLRNEGKVRFIGLSNHPTALLDRAEAIAHVDSVQPPFSAIKRGAGGDVIPWAKEHGTGVITYSPQQAGLLTGTFTLARAAALTDDDWRKREPEYQSPDLEKSLDLASRLVPIAERYGVTVGVIAIAWTLTWDGVSGAIVGARSQAQVDDWLPSLEFRLTEDDVAEITQAIVDSGAGVGPSHPGA